MARFLQFKTIFRKIFLKVQFERGDVNDQINFRWN